MEKLRFIDVSGNLETQSIEEFSEIQETTRDNIKKKISECSEKCRENIRQGIAKVLSELRDRIVSEIALDEDRKTHNAL